MYVNDTLPPQAGDLSLGGNTVGIVRERQGGLKVLPTPHLPSTLVALFQLGICMLLRQIARVGRTLVGDVARQARGCQVVCRCVGCCNSECFPAPIYVVD